ncbi:MAG: DUF4129 domain-containing protein, partial [Oscillospiraceae bacterium]|nr:DUF4129 domain-containing protein [Oscillospiraceae bacterium]
LRRRAGRVKTQAAGRRAVQAVERPKTPEEALALADREAAAGQPGRAMVLLMTALLLTLQAKGALRLETGRTNRQYLSDLRRAGRPEAAFFEAFSRAFNLFRYGGQEAESADYSRWRGGCEAFFAGRGRAAG